MTRATVVRQRDAKNFMEGAEHCREYVRDSYLWFGASVVPPGQRGDVDTGHTGAEEVFYCAAGQVLIFDGEHYDELEAGDALVIPPELPNTIVNIGEVPAVVIWAGAPGE